MPNLLLTGGPGVGKTTVLRKVAGTLAGLRILGFVTDEIRVEGRREGFRLTPFQGPAGILAHVSNSSPHRVGKYGVDVEALDRVVESDLEVSADADVYLIDEIGKMECFSARFITAVSALLDSGHRIVATIHQRAGGFVQRVKNHPDVELWQVTRGNRDGMPDRVVAWIRDHGADRAP
jgi:nucleoside-triphosphatase